MLIFSWLFLVIYGLVVAAPVCIFLRWYYRSEINNREATLIGLGKMCSELAKANDEAHKDSVRTAQLHHDEIAAKDRKIESLTGDLREASDREERTRLHVYAIRTLWRMNTENIAGPSLKRLADLEHERILSSAGYEVETEADRLADIVNKIVQDAVAKVDSVS